MFSIGDKIQYSTTGICTIIDIEQKNLGSIVNDYYVLKPNANEKARVYVPVNNQKLTLKMRKILTKQEILEIISSFSECPDIWIENNDKRREAFTEIVSSGDRKQILVLIRSLYMHKNVQAALGRKFHISDEKIFKEAERVLYDELSYVLEIEPTEVADYIQSHIS